MDIFLYADLALASLGVIVPMLILFIAVVIIVYVGHRRKQRMKVKKVIEELQIIHNTANNNGKYIHRPVFFNGVPISYSY